MLICSLLPVCNEHQKYGNNPSFLIYQTHFAKEAFGNSVGRTVMPKKIAYLVVSHFCLQFSHKSPYKFLGRILFF